MDAKAARALYVAEHRGARQIYGQSLDNYGGMCAMGALASAGIGLESMNTKMTECPACGERYSERGDLFFDEVDVIVHLNDDHKFTFSEIARKLGPDGA